MHKILIALGWPYRWYSDEGMPLCKVPYSFKDFLRIPKRRSQEKKRKIKQAELQAKLDKSW